MNKMERTNHGRGLALTMGLASMHECVLLEIVERLYAAIDGFNVCVLLEFVERLYAGIDGFNVCVLLEFIERLYAGIDGFNVCVLLEHSDSLCAGVVTACVMCVHAKICVGQQICNSLLKLSRLQRISIRC
jgi:hypothetical protein